MSRAGVYVLSNCPRDCYDGCGIRIEQRGERLHVGGNPDHPVSRGKLCAKCSASYNGVWQDARRRLPHPMRRTGAKGEGRFERIGWDEALESIAAELQQILRARGPEAILHTHYTGTLSLLGYHFPMRFFHRLGASEVAPDTICNSAGQVAWELLFGTADQGFDPRTAADSACIIVWGANPSHSAPHAHEHWLGEFPGTVVVVDPVRTATAEAADLHLQPFPGTDAALAFSLLHVLQRDGFFDQGFIAGRTLGADALLPALVPCTPEWGEAKTGVPAAAIERATRCYGQGPSLLWAGQALTRQRQGGNAMRAVGLLPALTGNVGKPGAGFYYLNSTPAMAGLDLERLAGAQLARDVPRSISHMDLAARLSDPGDYRALLCWNTNPAASAPRQRELRRALAREDLFTVVVDCFPTDTADYADIVLPAASFLEYDDLTYSYFHLIVGVQSKAREPMGESLPNAEIFRRLAGAMGFSEPELFEPDEAVIADMLAQMDVATSFGELQQRGWTYISEQAIVPFGDGRFPTPSGKIEIESERAEQMGLPRLPEPWADARPAAGALRLLSPASNWRLNDSYANEDRLRARAGEPAVFIHPEDAAQAGVSEGERVVLANDVGEIELVARLSERVLPGVALSHKGRWPKRERGAVNVNALNPGIKTDMGEGNSVHSTEVILRAAGPPPR